MASHGDLAIPAILARDLERRFFWWEPVGTQPRSHVRIIAQAMDLGGFADIRQLELTVEPERLAEVMLNAEPGWLSTRSWEFWRGRLAHKTGLDIPTEPPRRVFDGATA
jgi:hypothetical protein